MTTEKPSRITRRFREAVTERFRGTVQPGDVPVPSTDEAKPGDAEPIAGRYRVLSGPVGGYSGEAEVFKCRDEVLDQTVAVKLYRYDAVPKVAVIESLRGLVHPNLVRLLAYGHWRDRFFEVMEFCEGGVLADCMPATEQRLQSWLPAIVSGLDFAHRQGIVHRDIKPNNLFFRDAARTQPLIGDFGISSYLERPEKNVRETQTAANLTLDYAAPELIDGHEISAKTDYYGLGITLLHLALGRSPFHGMSHNDILVAHLRGRIDLPTEFSERFQTLVRGLTLGNPTARWGFEQVSGWLRGDDVDVDSRHGEWAVASGAGHPYPGYPQARTPRELAPALEHFQAARHLLRGDIRRWVFDHFDQAMADRIERIECIEGEPNEVILQRLKFILDPDSPLQAGEEFLGGLGDLANVLRRPANDPTRRALEPLIHNRLLEEWIEAGDRAGTRTPELLRRLGAMRVRLGTRPHAGVALDALLYILEPDTVLALGPGRSARIPLEVSRAFELDVTGVTPVLTEHIFSKRLDEWLRAAEFPDWQNDLEFLKNLRLRYLDQPELAVWCLCWRFDPELPFVFGDLKITEPRALSRLIDRNPGNTETGLLLLEKGWIRAWLVGTGKISDAAVLDQVLLSIDLSPRAKLEGILHLLDPTLPHPRLEVTSTRITFGALAVDSTRAVEMSIRNAGRGYLNGQILLEHYGEGLFLSDYTVEGNDVVVSVTIKTLGLPPGRYGNTLFLRTNGGRLEIPVQFTVRPPRDTRSGWEKLIDRFL